MPPAYRNEGDILIKNTRADPMAAWRMCGNRKCKICAFWYMDYRMDHDPRGHADFQNPSDPECWSCRTFFRKGSWRDSSPTWTLHKTFDKLDESARQCYTCTLVKQAILMDCPTSAHLEYIKDRRSPIWMLWREGDEVLRVEFGVWLRTLRLKLASSLRAIAQPSLLALSVLDAAPAMLQTCVLSDTHSACSDFHTGQQRLPTRVIDVGSGTDPPFLFITNGEAEQYCTLSYCWGSSSTAYNTTRANIVVRETELPIVSPELKMPKTYHDAIVITHRLDVRYLWIDAICIVQDDPADWRAEAAKMKSIYQNSYCTIAATGGINTDEGILSRQTSQIFDINKLQEKTNKDPALTHFDRHIIAPSPDKYRLISDSRLNSRGWILQEMLLSPQVLHFTAHCLYFECLQHTISEVDIHRNINEDDNPSETKTKRAKSVLANQASIDDSVAHKMWLDIVFQYTRKDLTVETDYLPAIAGVAEQLSHSINSRYVAGLWLSHIPDGLQWVVAMNPVGKPQTLTRRPTAYIAPSGYWASIVGPVSSTKEPMGKCNTHWEREEWESAIDILDCQPELVDSQRTFGQIRHAFLRIRARLRKASFAPKATEGPAYDGMVHTCEAYEMPFPREIKCAIRFDVLEEYATHSSRENLFCLELYRCTRSEPSPVVTKGLLEQQGASPYFYDRPLFHALVLEATGVQNQFKRVGFAKITTRAYFDKAERGEIEIV